MPRSRARCCDSRPLKDAAPAGHCFPAGCRTEERPTQSVMGTSPRQPETGKHLAWMGTCRTMPCLRSDTSRTSHSPERIFSIAACLSIPQRLRACCACSFEKPISMMSFTFCSSTDWLAYSSAPAARCSAETQQAGRASSAVVPRCDTRRLARCWCVYKPVNLENVKTAVNQ